ncbi:Peroxisomal nicotinamide adenine dinucleotide carrier [Psilocybe cubensis]|uniref:Peroxisomal nicotinamide adenine dinucleotide carrier n=2 Tax=Psilocybe cubensis TaxID=181762 RepID=A0ACB8H5J5_PSICU|nr:Peroxisomal nicotinamide adenine dinucleotide carrier [Psilocybe cubensis]KAH9482977.1 Peroxisomal nicotinamide adenine dinucleotide carrier [Psilocybe cubensis]
MSDSAIHAVAGAAGGIVAMTATYPLIFLSTRAAVETKKEQKSTYQAIIDIIKREGVLGLYSGLDSSLLGIAVTNGVYYYFYERSREAILRTRTGGSKALSTLESMLTGLIAGSATTIISNPIWVIQTSQAVRTMGSDGNTTVTKKLGFLETVQSILAKDGIGALWRGIGPALVLVINPIIQYTAFEQLKNFLITRRTAKLRAAAGAATAVAVLTDMDFFVLGALSKLVATSITYPYIVVKSRLQAGSANALRYKSSIDGLLTILKEEGIEGLYKGIGSKIVQSVLTAAILFAGQRRIFEITKASLQPLIKA